MKVLLSIKPEFANKIFDGTKLFEFRRAIFKNPNIKTVVVYASSPVQKVIGEFEIDHILKQDIKSLWFNTAKHSGIQKDYFHQYFNGREFGFAIKVKNPKLYKKAQSLKDDYKKLPPQSFCYLEM